MVGRGRAQEILCRLACEVAIVETRSMARKKNFRTEFSRKLRTRCIFPSTQGTEEFIRDTSFRNVEDHRVLRLAVVENEIGRRPGGISFRIEIMPINKENSLRPEEQHPRERS